MYEPLPFSTRGVILSAVSLENVTKTFGDLVAVSEVNLHIEKGEFLVILGPSGCGKTTLLRLIAGFLEPTSGTILIGGRDVSQLPANKRNIGIVFQNYALFPHKTTFENVAYGLKIRNLPEDEIKRKVTTFLGTFGLTGTEDRYPRELSGGQQQRVALARALIIEPDILLLDEPLSNLDYKLRIQLRSEIKRVHDQFHTTSIYVTHDQGEALVLSDRIAVLKNGHVEQVSDPKTLYERPRTSFIADFIGEANILEGKISRTERGVSEIVTNETMLIAVDSSKLDHVPSDGKVSLCIRPEKITVSPKSKNIDRPNIYPGVIQEVIFEGAKVRYVLRTAYGTTLIADRQVTSTSQTQHHEGEEVLIECPLENWIIL